MKVRFFIVVLGVMCGVIHAKEETVLKKVVESEPAEVRLSKEQFLYARRNYVDLDALGPITNFYACSNYCYQHNIDPKKVTSLRLQVGEADIPNYFFSQQFPSLEECILVFPEPTTLSPRYFRRAGLSHISILRIRCQSGLTLAPKCFLHLSNLKVLDMSLCGITSVDDEYFHGMDNLQELDLSHNYLQSLPMSAFHSLPNLLILDLEYNRITDIAFGAFFNLNNLRVLLLLRGNYINKDHSELLRLKQHISPNVVIYRTIEEKKEAFEDSASQGESSKNKKN